MGCLDKHKIRSRTFIRNDGENLPSKKISNYKKLKEFVDKYTFEIYEASQTNKLNMSMQMELADNKWTSSNKQLANGNPIIKNDYSYKFVTNLGNIVYIKTSMETVPVMHIE